MIETSSHHIVRGDPKQLVFRLCLIPLSGTHSPPSTKPWKPKSEGDVSVKLSTKDISATGDIPPPSEEGHHDQMADVLFGTF
jgi:hypothetical protein